MVAIALIVIVGLIKAGSHGFQTVAPAPHRATEALGVLLVLRAFASGATAMTGIEVISNAVPVFRPPEAEHARQTLAVMVGLLISMFVGVVLVAHFDGAAPGGDQTVLSQIAHRSVGGGLPYAFVQLATTLVLLVAANSAFNGFPRLLYFMLVSPYRATVAPLANYIAALHRQRPDVTLTLIVPEIIVAKRWQRILHNRIAARLRASLVAYEGIIITTVPFHLPR